MANSACKYCGAQIKWTKEGARWIPLDPETGLSHQSVCRAAGAGGAVKLKTGRVEHAQGAVDNARMAGLERRVAAVEEKLGIKPLTYNPFKNLTTGQPGQ